VINVPENVKIAIANAAVKTGVPENILTAFAYVESGFRPAVISGEQKSPTKVQGLFQITESTWEDNRHNTPYSLDINEQAYTAGLLIRKLLNQYGNDPELTCIAYNAGPGVANRLKRSGINRSAVEDAVAYYRNQGAKGFGPGKVDEIMQYPIKLRAALGGNYAVAPSASYNYAAPSSQLSEDKDVSASSQGGEQPTVDPEKSFVENLFAGASKEVRSMAEVVEKSDIANSKLVNDIRAGMAKG